MDGSWCSNHPAKKMSQWCMARVFDYLIQYVTLCNEINCVGKIWCRPFERYIDHFIPISSSWDMDQSFNIGTSLGRFFDSLYVLSLFSSLSFIFLNYLIFLIIYAFSKTIFVRVQPFPSYFELPILSIPCIIIFSWCLT